MMERILEKVKSGTQAVEDALKDEANTERQEVARKVLVCAWDYKCYKISAYNVHTFLYFVHAHECSPVYSF